MTSAMFIYIFGGNILICEVKPIYKIINEMRVSCCHNNNTTRSKASVVAYSPTWLKQSTKQNNGEAWQGLFSVHIQRVFLLFVCLLAYTSCIKPVCLHTVTYRSTAKLSSLLLCICSVNQYTYIKWYPF